jgi:hypothetical protein
MSTETTYSFLSAIVVGVGATLFMDLLALFLKRTFRIPTPNYCLVGRWVSHMVDGTFKHASIAAATQKHSECTVGWIAHYVVGVVYALLLVVFVLAPCWCHFSSCSHRSGSVLLHPERPNQRRPDLEVLWRILPSESACTYVPLA